MYRSVNKISGIIGLTALALAGIALVSTTGCQQKKDTSPLMTGTPAQVDQAMTKDAQNYAAFRKAQATAPAAGQAPTQ